MNVEKLNQRLTLAANLGVIVGIVFLAVEISQNTDMMRAQTRSSETASIMTLLEMERHPHVVSGYLKQNSGQDLTNEEIYFLENQANATIRQWENSFYQYQAGLFDEAEYAAAMEFVRLAMLEENMADHWAKRQLMYSKAFRDHINSVLHEPEM